MVAIHHGLLKRTACDIHGSVRSGGKLRDSPYNDLQFWIF